MSANKHKADETNSDESDSFSPLKERDLQVHNITKTNSSSTSVEINKMLVK